MSVDAVQERLIWEVEVGVAVNPVGVVGGVVSVGGATVKLLGEPVRRKDLVESLKSIP